MKVRGIPLRLQRVSGRCDIPGNDAADRLAKEVVGPNETEPLCHPALHEKKFTREQVLNQWEQEWRTSKKGSHLRQIDTTLLSICSRQMYGLLPWDRIYLLT